jgi:hypothetical protein
VIAVDPMFWHLPVPQHFGQLGRLRQPKRRSCRRVALLHAVQLSCNSSPASVPCAQTRRHPFRLMDFLLSSVLSGLRSDEL